MLIYLYTLSTSAHLVACCEIAVNDVIPRRRLFTAMDLRVAPCQINTL